MRFILNKFVNLRERFLLSKNELRAINRIKEISKNIPVSTSEFTVIVDGIIGMKSLSLYFVLLLLSMKYHAKCKIRTVVITATSRHKFLIANRIYKLSGDTFIHSFEDRLSGIELSQLDSEYQLIIANINSPDDLLNLIIDDVPFGKNIYGSYIRQRRIGSISEIDQSVKDAVRNGLRNYFVVKKILGIYSPSLVLLSDSVYDTFGALFFGALRKDVAVAVSGHFPDGRCFGRVYSKLEQFTTVERNYVFSLTSNTWDKVIKQYGEPERLLTEKYLANRFNGKDVIFDGKYHENTKKLPPLSIRSRLGVNGNHTKIVLIAAHLLWDDATASYQALYRDYEIWLVETLNKIKAAPEIFWILKAHPSELHLGTTRRVSDVYREVYSESPPPNVVFIDANSDINTYSLIDASDAVLTVRGTIGFEAACKGKLVINAGTGPYSGLGFNVEFNSQEEYENYLLRLSTVNTELAEHQIEMAKIATYGYLMYKYQSSDLLSKRKALRDYSSLDEKEIVNDSTLRRYALQLHSGIAGDML
jgi:hypothetical protein